MSKLFPTKHEKWDWGSRGLLRDGNKVKWISYPWTPSELSKENKKRNIVGGTKRQRSDTIISQSNFCQISCTFERKLSVNSLVKLIGHSVLLQCGSISKDFVIVKAIKHWDPKDKTDFILTLRTFN